MDYLLALLQGLGIAAAIGIRPFLPTLLVGALAAGDLGLDYDGTDFAFLEQTGFLLAVVVAVAVFGIIDRRRHADTTGQGTVVVLLLICSLALGALSAAGSIADVSSDWWPGVPIGVAAASVGFMSARSLFSRVSARLDAEAAKALPLYAEGIALIGAGLSVLFPPLAILLVAALAWLLVGGRRREGEKYAGLRILR
jgi:Domain of unknown function (DUF4126)